MPFQKVVSPSAHQKQGRLDFPDNRLPVQGYQKDFVSDLSGIFIKNINFPVRTAANEKA